MRSAVNEHFVGAATKFAIDHCAVHQRERAILDRFDMRVITRGARVIQHDGVVGARPMVHTPWGRKLYSHWRPLASVIFRSAMTNNRISE